MIRERTTAFTETYLASCENQSVDANWDALKKHLLNMLEQYVPAKYRSSRYNLPWLTQRLKRQIWRKRRLYNKARRSKKELDWAAYKKLKRHLKKAIKDAHSQYINSVLTDALEEGNTKPFWSYVKSRRQDSSGVAPLKRDGILHTSSSDKAGILSEQFSSVFTVDKMDDIPPMSGGPYPKIDDLEITSNGIEKLLNRLVATKAPGPDCIPNRLLKELAAELAPALAALFNQSIQTGQLPADWRRANISPIFKKDDKHIAANYRPVSLTCVCSKILEHCIVSHIMSHLDRHKILSDLQHGFRQRRSCVTQLLLTVSDIARSHDQNVQVDLSILDFSKAFDVVSHRKLLAKLRHYGIDGTTNKWIQGFLENREQSVVVEGVSSEPVPVLSGVPQGTCLGPILFLCYVNDITENIQSQMRLFADDALLYRPIHSPTDQQILQRDLITLQNWATKWDMKFNPKKCYIMSMKHSGEKQVYMYSLCNVVLQTVATNPYLGVLLSDDLTFTAHIRKICSKSSRTLGFISRNLKHCPNKLRENAYFALCRSILEYASAIWDPYLVAESNLLERIQRKAARVTVRDFGRRSSVTTMLQNLGWEPLDQRRKRARLILMFQIISGEVEVPADEFLKPGRRGRFLHIPHRYAAYKNSYYPRTIRDYNDLPTATKESASVEVFKSRLPQGHY